MGVSRQSKLYQAAPPTSTVSLAPQTRVTFTTAVVLHANPAGSGEMHLVTIGLWSTAGSTVTITINGIATTNVLAANGQLAPREIAILPGQSLTISATATTVVDAVVRRSILV